MLMVMKDRFLKWMELVPLRNATAESLKKAFREHIIARYGVPKMVISDNGVQFASRILRVSWLRWVSVNNSPHHTHHKRIRPIEQTEQSRPEKLDEKWPDIMLAVNTSTSESTGHTPAFLTQGRSTQQPI